MFLAAHRPVVRHGWPGQAVGLAHLLALLTGRTCSYGYGTVERFVALLARTAAPDALTTMLAQWSTRLWHADRGDPLGVYLLPFPVYLDGHKKPVFSDVLVPRGRMAGRARFSAVAR